MLERQALGDGAALIDGVAGGTGFATLVAELAVESGQAVLLNDDVGRLGRPVQRPGCPPPARAEDGRPACQPQPIGRRPFGSSPSSIAEFSRWVWSLTGPRH